MKSLTFAPMLTVAACLLSASPAFSQEEIRTEASPSHDRPTKPQPQMQTWRTLPEDRKNIPPQVHEAMERALRQSIERTPWMDAPAAAAPWRIGVMTAPIEPALRIHLKIPNEIGVMVREVVEGSPAAKAGLRSSDIILAAGDRRIGNLDGLKEAVLQAGKTGEPLTLEIIHEGQRRKAKILPNGPPGERPETQRPQPEAVLPLLERQNHRIEEMNNHLKRMQAQLDRQQHQIEAFQEHLAEHSKPETPSDQGRPRNRESD